MLDQSKQIRELDSIETGRRIYRHLKRQAQEAIASENYEKVAEFQDKIMDILERIYEISI